MWCWLQCIKWVSSIYVAWSSQFTIDHAVQNNQWLSQGSTGVSSDTTISVNNAWILTLQTIPALSAWGWCLQVCISFQHHASLECFSNRSEVIVADNLKLFKRTPKPSSSTLIIYLFDVYNVYVLHRYLPAPLLIIVVADHLITTVALYPSEDTGAYSSRSKVMAWSLLL